MRTSRFTYYGAADGAKAGLLKTETVEPGKADLCVTTEYLYDAFGNKINAKTSNCAGASTDAVFTLRGTSSDFTSGPTQTVPIAAVPVTPVNGTFVTKTTNAKGHTETYVVDPRFGTVISLKGPNQITTSWQLDEFGRKVQESRADGTQTNTAYCTISGRGVDADADSLANGPLPSCAGLLALLDSGEVPAAAVMFVHTASFKGSTQIGPASRAYMDRAGRKLRTVTEGFDSTSQPADARLILQDIGYSDLGVQTLTTQPYFLVRNTSTTTSATGYGQSRTDIDALGRPIRVAVVDPLV